MDRWDIDLETVPVSSLMSSHFLYSRSQTLRTELRTAQARCSACAFQHDEVLGRCVAETDPAAAAQTLLIDRSICQNGTDVAHRHLRTNDTLQPPLPRQLLSADKMMSAPWGVRPTQA